MKILILGNLGAGKTTVAEKLNKRLRYSLCLIDDYRKKYGDRTVPGEYLALYHFLQACVKGHNAILEFTGAGCHKFAIKKALEDSKMRVVVVLIDVPPHVCKERIADRQWDIPIPSWDFDLNHHLEFVEEDLTIDMQKGFWIQADRFLVKKYSNREKNDLERITDEISSLIDKRGQQEG